MKVVVAPDKFKGTATAIEIAGAMAAAVEEAGHEAIVMPMADGGDGTLEALGGANRTSMVTGPDGTKVQAAWRLSRREAVIEMALASGLVLAGGPEQNDPLNATTRGTGELIRAAVTQGARRIIVGLGGSATTDGGLGALEAIGSRARVAGVQLEVATDVETKFVDAAEVFGPQKGATPAQIAFLKARLEGLATRYVDEFDVDVRDIVGGGAAGGLGGGLAAVGATIIGGFDLIAEELGFFEALENADLVLTGEGALDRESFAGKVVGGVAQAAKEFDLPVLAVVGVVEDGFTPPAGEVSLVRSLTEVYGEADARAEPIRLARALTLAALGDLGPRT